MTSVDITRLAYVPCSLQLHRLVRTLTVIYIMYNTFKGLGDRAVLYHQIRQAPSGELLSLYIFIYRINYCSYF